MLLIKSSCLISECDPEGLPGPDPAGNGAGSGSSISPPVNGLDDKTPTNPRLLSLPEVGYFLALIKYWLNSPYQIWLLFVLNT